MLDMSEYFPDIRDDQLSLLLVLYPNTSLISRLSCRLV